MYPTIYHMHQSRRPRSGDSSGRFHMETLCYANIAMKLLEGNLLVQIPPIWDKHMLQNKRATNYVQNGFCPAKNEELHILDFAKVRGVDRIGSLAPLQSFDPRREMLGWSSSG